MQAKDKLEKVILENRAAFDSAEPKQGLWNKIEQGLEEQKPANTPRVWYWKAAVVVLLAAVTFLMVDRYLPEPASAIESSNIQEFQEIESFYKDLINNKQERLSAEMNSVDASELLQVEMQQLDDIYSDLKLLFLEDQPSEQVMDRLIHLLRQKLRVMDKQLEVIEKDKLPDEMKQDLEKSL